MLLAGCSLSAPPPQRGDAPLLTPVAAPQTSEVFELPSRRPSAVNGATLYAERCAACHGLSGHGDGESAQQIQSTFGALPANLTAESTARTATAAQWFTTVTNGRIENGMPPFAEGLTVDERWDVIAYVWTLGASVDQLVLGSSIYAERCVQCHGESGRGDGASLDFSDPALYRDVAAGQWDNALNVSHVPSFSGKLSAAERSAVIDYARSFVYDTSVAEVETTPVPEATHVPAAPGQLTVNGTVVNRTEGAALPAHLEAVVYHFPGGAAQNVITQTTALDASGHFAVSDLQEIQPGDVVAAVVGYGNVTYPSELITIAEDTTSVDLAIDVYEETTDTSAIRIDAFHAVITPNGDALTVEEVYVLSNGGDRVVANTQQAALLFELPDAASAFQLLSGAAPEAVADTPDGFGYFDAIIPGDAAVQLAIRYQLPAASAFDRNFAYPVVSTSVLVESSAPALSSEQLVDQGELPVQGNSYKQYSGSVLAAGERLAFRLGGGTPTTIVGVAVLAVMIVAGAFVFLRKRAPQPAMPLRKASSAERERLLDQIAALDDAFDAGDIKEADYHRQRDALKQKLVQMIRDT